jgi:GDSL-like Lipase/Acylhydrolase family
VLAIGDSWFCYPFNNLANPLHRVLNRSQRNVILVRGHNGAKAVEYQRGPIRKQIEGDLDKKLGYGRTIRAVFLSGGGNDFSGRDDMKSILLQDCSKLSDPSECFRNGQPETLFDTVQEAILSVVDLVAEKLPGVPVFIHGYDYPNPNGQGFLGLGQWLQYPMDESKVERALQQDVVNDLIDSFAGMLVDTAKLRTSLNVVDARKTLRPDQWANELHPAPRGFNKLATVWEVGLKKAGVA